MGTSNGVFPGLILDPSLDRDTAFLSAEAFQFVLGRQLAGAQRYGHYFTLVLMGLDRGRDLPCWERAVQIVARKLRRSDYLGKLDDQTIGVILQHASEGDAQKVVKRLSSEASSAFPGGQRRVSFSSAVYPTEANTVPDLKILAAKRLKGNAVDPRSMWRVEGNGDRLRDSLTSDDWADFVPLQ